MVSPDLTLTSVCNLFGDLSAKPAVWAASKGIGPYIRQHFLDTTFRGLYHANAFDVALLIPYFVVLILLAGYGMHRYVLVYLYYKHQMNRTTEPPARFEDLPRITVQLPIFNEQYVIDRLLERALRQARAGSRVDVQQKHRTLLIRALAAPGDADLTAPSLALYFAEAAMSALGGGVRVESPEADVLVCRLMFPG